MINSELEYHFTLLRHGESVGNIEGRFQGQADYPLTSKGLKQARILATYWQNNKQVFDHIISSPLSRAKETANIIAVALNLSLTFESLLLERDYGEQSQLTHKKAMSKFPLPRFVHPFRPVATTGESIWELYLRAGEALNCLLKFDPGHYLIVAHGGLLNMLMHTIVGLAPHPEFQGVNFCFLNTGFTTLIYKPENNNWTILGHNARPHL